MLVVLALLDWIPAAIARHGGSASGFRLMGLALLAGFVTVHLQISGLSLSRNIVTVARAPIPSCPTIAPTRSTSC